MALVCRLNKREKLSDESRSNGPCAHGGPLTGFRMRVSSIGVMPSALCAALGGLPPTFTAALVERHVWNLEEVVGLLG
jgi:hypothetical protein